MAALLDIVKKGSTDRSVAIRIIDSTDGTPETGVVFNTAGIDLWYRREGAAVVSITEATLAALTTAHSDGGFLHVSDGEYRLDLPDAAFATGANYVDVGGTVTGMVVIGGRVRLVNYDPEDTVRLGLTALPNAAADAAGGLPISDAGGLDLDTIGSNVSTLVTRITSTLFSGITSLAEWLGLIAGKQVGNTTARTELRATGAGSGTFDETTDSQEAIRDRGDAAYLTATGFSTHTAADVRTEMDSNSTQLAAIVADTNELQTDDVPGLIAALNNISTAQVNAEVDTALADYDPPTRAELTSDINSIISILRGMSMVNGTIGATGNDTTHLHLTGLTYGDDEINDLLLVVFDNSNSEYHSRWITDWVNTTALATVSTLPFTPENSVDTYWILSIRKDSGLTAAQVNAEVDTALSDYDGPTRTEATADKDEIITEVNANEAKIDTIDSNVDSILVDTGTTLENHLTDIKGATFDTATDSLEAIRDRGDAAWTTGGGGSISDILATSALIPPELDLANTASWRLGWMLTNALDDLPSTAEIDPGTISIERKAIGGTSWTAIVTDAACSEAAGMIYYDEVFDSGSGYAEGDSIRITLKAQKITVAANDYEIANATGVYFYTSIRQTMRGTDSAALASALATLQTTASGIQTDLDNGTDGLGAIKAVVDAVLVDTGTTIPAQISALNNLSAAQVNAEVDTALSDIGATLARMGYLDNINGHTAQTGDSFARLGAPSGLTIAADILTVINDLANGTDGLGAIFAAIGGLNNLSSAEAQTAAAAALTAYDPPTNAEMEARTLVAASYATAANQTTMDGKLDTIQTSLPPRIARNTAYPDFTFIMVDTNGDPATGLTVTATRSINAAAFAACANSVTEISNGAYTIDLDASDLNGAEILLRFNATGAKDLFIKIPTTV